MGGFDSAAIKADGTLWTWGLDFGQLARSGDDTMPGQVGTDTDWSEVSVAGQASSSLHMLGIRTDGTLWGWGANWLGQLGLGSYYSMQYTPIQIGTDTGWDSVSAGAEHSLAVKLD